MAKATSVESSSDRKGASLESWAISFRYSTNVQTLADDLPFELSCNFISQFECMNAMCVLNFQQNKLFMHSARSGDSIAWFKDRIETVYLDPCGEFLTQVLIHYMGQLKW